MDIEKIKSLIRLANNNPNDNEANLAARKVCRELAENNFAALTSSSNGNPTTWNDVKRSTEPAWRSKPHSGYRSHEDIFNDIFGRHYKYTNQREGSWEPKTVYENECAECHVKYTVPKEKYHPQWVCPSCIMRARETREKQKPQYEWAYTGFDENPFYQPFYPDGKPRSSPRTEKKIRKCSKCGKEVETKRVTSVFTCDTCEWTAYKKQKKDKKRGVPHCKRCKKPISRYEGITDCWYCDCGTSKITSIEAAARGIKFT